MLNRFANVLDGIEGLYEPMADLESQIGSLSMRSVLWSALFIILLVLVGSLIKDKYPKLKLSVFLLIVGTTITTTLIIVVGTVYLNVRSDSGGPVHWHADIEYWACGNQIELRDPMGLSNKIGTPTLHEHDDQRIHLEGVVVDGEVDASLGKFMHVIGGAVTPEALVIPLNDDRLVENDTDGDAVDESRLSELDKFIVEDETGRFLKLLGGQKCGDEEAEVQVFRFRDNGNDTYFQEKLDDPIRYTIRDNSIVPPGDCIIFEFDTPKERTERLCAQYGILDNRRCEEFGVDRSENDICTMTEVKPDGSPLDV